MDASPFVPDTRSLKAELERPGAEEHEGIGAVRLMRRALDGFVGGMATGLAEHAATVETGRSSPR